MRRQQKQSEWTYEWTVLEDRTKWLFVDWILPNRLEDFKGKTVLDAGCGAGHHILITAPLAKRVVGVDLNASAVARGKTKNLSNVEIFEGDIASWDKGERFDIVYSIGVPHHTANPDRTVEHLKKLVTHGGRLIIRVYSKEGNAINRWIHEPLKAALISHLPRPIVLVLSHLVTLALFPFIHTLYRLPLKFLPYHDYFRILRRLSYKRCQLAVFDQMNAPTTFFIDRAQVERWMKGMNNVSIRNHWGITWNASGTKP